MSTYGSILTQPPSTAPKQDSLVATLHQISGNLNDIQAEIAMLSDALEGPMPEKSCEPVAGPCGAIGLAFDIRSRSARLASALRNARIKISD